jgi:hypothetical protein
MGFVMHAKTILEFLGLFILGTGDILEKPHLALVLLRIPFKRIDNHTSRFILSISEHSKILQSVVSCPPNCFVSMRFCVAFICSIKIYK